jgi:DNA-directed RNA polymerase specialized sigma24 family protein
VTRFRPHTLTLVTDRRQLAPDARIVVTLRFQEDLDMSEIAAITEMPVNTVKSHLRRSMDALRRKLQGKGHAYES